LNVILVLIDSLNKHYLSAYSDTHVATPNLTKFAEKSWRFNNHFVGSLPCMPARREIFSGFKEMLWRPWGPLEPFDERLPKLLEANDYATAIVTDHYHYWEEAANGYMQSFKSAELVRGHEIDFWKSPISADESVPKWVDNIDVWRNGWGRRYYSNVKDFKIEEDFFPAKVMTGAVNWLNANAKRQPFFLQVESFDVHEPFHVPEPYASMYGDPAAADKYTLWPPYQDVDKLADFMSKTSDAELEFIRAQYSGKLTMVDRWFGELLNTFDQLNLWDDTAIIVTTDHGHDLGERGKFGKQYPHWDSHANIPMFVWHPDYPGNGGATDALTQTVDMFATVLDTLNVPLPERTHSRSIVPTLRGESGREALLYGTFGQGVCCTNGEWSLLKSPEHDEPLFYYSSLIFNSLVAEEITQSPIEHGHYIPGVQHPQWKVPTRFRVNSREDYLFNRREDPGQQDNRWTTDKAQREQMLAVLHDLLKTEGLPPEQVERLGLS
jgi:arylsulfatase A-like enzyme